MGAVALLKVAALERIKNLVVSIVSPETEVAARKELESIRIDKRAFEKQVKDLKQPYKEAIAEIDAAAKPWLELLASKDQEIERAILDYGRRVREQVAKDNAKTLAKFERKVEKALDKAAENGAPMPLVLPPSLAVEPPKTVTTETGARQTTVKRKAWRLAKSADYDPETLTADLAHVLGLPLEYFKLDTARIGKVVRAGGSIPGVEVYEEESIAVKA